MASLLKAYERYVTELALTKFKTSDINWFLENREDSVDHLRMLTLLVARNRETFWTCFTQRDLLNLEELFKGILHVLFTSQTNEKVSNFCKEMIVSYDIPYMQIDSNEISAELIKGVNTFLLWNYKLHKDAINY